MNKADKFNESLQELSRFAKVLSHPARLSILKYLAETKKCISGDISEFLPLGRTTVSQHLKELREIGIIKGEIDGLKINYCLNNDKLNAYLKLYDVFFQEIRDIEIICKTN
jgi:DNA-binding transcriptional ArsR family regulator